MKNTFAPSSLKLQTLGIAGIGLVLRSALYATGVDGRGLLEDFHWAQTLLWALTIGTVILLAKNTRPLPKTGQAKALPLAGLGGFPLAAVLAVSGVVTLTNDPLPLDILSAVLGIAAAASLIFAGAQQMLGKRPFWLLFAVVCVFFTFRTVCQYRAWCTHPQLQDYLPYLWGHLALMFTAYYRAADSAEIGNIRALWAFSMGAVFFCCTAIPMSDAPLLLVFGALWAFCAPGLPGEDTP